MKYKNIIFDFDGVLAESMHIKTQAFYKLYEPFGNNVAEQVVKHHQENGGMSRFEKFPFYHKTFLNLDIDNSDIKLLSKKFSDIVVQDVISSEEVAGANWFLEKNSNANKWVVSATPTDEISEIIEKRNMSKYFKKVYGSPDKKVPIVKRIINENHLQKDETIFLGDALNDYEAAKKNNIDFGLRKTNENKKLFFKKTGMVRFIDFYELDKILENKT